MTRKINQKTFKKTALVQAGLIMALLFWLSASAFGQTADAMQTAATMPTKEMQKSEPAKATMMPVLQNYKNVKLGATDDEVRDLLGKKAVIDDKDGFFYQFDDEMAQIRLDADKKVYLIVVTYMNGNKNAPQFADVFGADVKAEPNADGSLYKIVRYPEAGYWVGYSRTAGDKPTVTVTMQKL